MAEQKISFLGPLSEGGESVARKQVSVLRRLPVAFLLAVVAPTVIAAIYYLLIATPRYVSEARFVVRAPSQEQPSSLGVALQGVGIPTSQTDAFAVHEYITSRDALRELQVRVDVAGAYRDADPLSRLPRFWEGGSFEDLYRGFKGYVTVGYDSTTGISTLRVEAFDPNDAQRIADSLLSGGENLVNRLNLRSRKDAVSEAEGGVAIAQSRLTAAQVKLTAFRNHAGFVDPAKAAIVGGEMLGELAVQLATLKAERAQVAADAPQSPQLRILDSRIAAFERQISIEQQKLAGDATSLASKISTYEQLVMDRQFADRAFATAMLSLDNAELEARRKSLYLDRIVNPNRPDEPALPLRWMAILAVFGGTLVAYGTIWLIWAGVRESRLD